ncbi:hypothetical protein [Brevibacillus antibioticus]|uniref:hypothetical protein n=1 Tax=Brevibacillus antibioticus TaxID=2570228 RepID=UPI001ABF47DE|nr:hypothetical protein [Brevibacillus antibioticus]
MNYFGKTVSLIAFWTSSATRTAKAKGWEKHDVELDLTDGGIQKFFDSWTMNGSEVATHWRPLHNIADAWMIVEKFKELTIWHT